MKINALRSDFARNILKLVSGTFIAQILSILIAPILTRLYAPEYFGLFTLISSIFGIIALIAGGRYEIAILLPKKDEDAANLLILSLLINTFFLAIFYAVLFCVVPFLGTGIDIFWIYSLPIFVFFVGYAQSIMAWFNRKKNYNAIVVNKISNSLSNNSLALLNGFLKTKLNGLLLAFLIANLISLLLLFIQIKNDFHFIKSSFDKVKMIELAKKYIHFPLFNSFQALLDAFQLNGLIYFISFFFGAANLGFFSLALRILMMPMNLMGASLSQVFFQEASEKFNNNENLIPFMRKMMLRSLIIASPILLVLLFFAPWIFQFVFGEKWIQAGYFAQIISPWILFDFVRAPLSQIPLIYNQQQKMLYFTLLSNIVILIALSIGTYFHWSLYALLAALAISQCLYITLLISWIFNLAKKRMV